jgi:excisionase family DNA binding protein
LPGDWLTVAEVADLLGVSRQRIQRACRDRLINGQRAGHLWLIHADELQNAARVIARQR